MKRITIISISLIALAALSALGVWHVCEKAEPSRVEAFSNRFIDAELLSFSASEGATADLDNDSWTLAWQETSAQDVYFSTKSITLTDKNTSNGSTFQFDLSIGGTQNAAGMNRMGYTVWLEAILYAGDKAGASKHIEIPLESVKERPRVYSLQVASDGVSYDSFVLRLTVKSLEETLRAGTITCSHVEVIKQ